MQNITKLEGAVGSTLVLIARGRRFKSCSSNQRKGNKDGVDNRENKETNRRKQTI